jgi:hypothetical protein
MKPNHQMLSFCTITGSKATSRRKIELLKVSFGSGIPSDMYVGPVHIATATVVKIKRYYRFFLSRAHIS